MTIGGVVQGLSTFYVYDDNLTDASGLDVTYATQFATLGSGYFAVGSDGYAVEMTNPEGEKTVRVMDGTGRTVMMIDGEGHASKVSYDTMVASISGAPGQLLSMVNTDALGHSTTRYADGDGRVLAVKDVLDKFMLFGVDSQDNQVKVRDPNVIGQDCVYDELGRKTQCTDTHGDVTQWAYDLNGNQTKFTDAKSKDELCVFDARDRRIQCTDRNSGVTNYAYDANNNLLSIEDADAVANSTGKKTLYEYDARNRQSSEAYPDHNPAATVNTIGYDKVIYGYDGQNRLTSRQDQKGESITYNFDLASRLLARGYPDSNNDGFTYDKASRLLTATSARYTNTVTRTYNDDGTLATEALTTNGQSYTVGYGYDDANRNTSITYPDGKGVARAYTDRNELQNVKYDNSDVITRSYDDGRRLSSTTYGNGLVESRSYITNDNLIASLGIPSVTGFGYSWDANKNKTAETDGILANYSWSTGANGYDDIDRLIGWSRTNGDSQSWSLSKVGDWDSTTVNGTAETRTHNAVHELTQRGTNALAYDLKGNLTRNAGDTVDRYVWDYDNKLKGADTDQDGAADAVYAYDALGRRVSKTIASTSTSTVYVSALNQEIAEYPAGTAASAPTYDYVFGDYVDEVLLRVTAATGTRHYYHQDSLYCVRAIVRLVFRRVKLLAR